MAKTDFSRYDNTTVHIEGIDGISVTGACQSCPPEFCADAVGRDEEGLRVGNMYFFADDIRSLELIRPEACIPMREYPEAREEAAAWFHEKWHHPVSAYEESIRECIGNCIDPEDIDDCGFAADDSAGDNISGGSSAGGNSAGGAGANCTAGKYLVTSTSRRPVPQWYVVLRGSRIIAGCGVIENDFHERKDLAPNVCAVYVEEEFRGQGVAGFLLDFVCEDMAALGVRTLYLLTDHIGFYERYGWQFLCMAQGDGDPEPSRMYMHYR